MCARALRLQYVAANEARAAFAAFLTWPVVEDLCLPLFVQYFLHSCPTRCEINCAMEPTSIALLMLRAHRARVFHDFAYTLLLFLSVMPSLFSTGSIIFPEADTQWVVVHRVTICRGAPGAHDAESHFAFLAYAIRLLPADLHV